MDVVFFRPMKIAHLMTKIWLKLTKRTVRSGWKEIIRCQDGQGVVHLSLDLIYLRWTDLDFKGSPLRKRNEQPLANFESKLSQIWPSRTPNSPQIINDYHREVILSQLFIIEIIFRRHFYLNLIILIKLMKTKNCLQIVESI